MADITYRGEPQIAFGAAKRRQGQTRWGVSDGERKRCTKCLTWRALDEFYRKGTNYDGFAHECKPCLKKRLAQRKA